jgi:cytochrome P450
MSPCHQSTVLRSFQKILRLCPAAPNGIPRVVSRKDNYKGFRIPKGATVVTNFWGMQRSPDDYDRPNEFLPERYLSHPLGLKTGAQETAAKRATYTFGAGRRICPGDQFAQNSVLVAMSKLLWAYSIVPTEKAPLDLDVETAFHPGLILGPEPFKVDFVLRDAAREEAVLRDYDEAQAVLGGFGL